LANLSDPATGDPASLGIDAARLAANTADAAYVKGLGTRLHSFLFETAGKDRIQTALDRSLGAAQARDLGLRIRLMLAKANPEVAGVPWEFLYADALGGFVACSIHTPVVRFLEVNRPLKRPEARLPLKLLAVIPSVTDLNVDTEKERLMRAVHGIDPPVEPIFLEGTVTRQRVSDALTVDDIDILHFVGHGKFENDRGYLRLNKTAFDADWIDHEALGKLVLNRRSLKLVVLNTCVGAEISTNHAFTGIAPQLVLCGVPAVVAMQYPILDGEALTFVHAFYKALFQGSSRGLVEAAMCAGRTALDRDFPGTRAVGLPALFIHYKEGVLFQVVSGTGKLIRDAPYKPHEAAKQRALIRELKANTAKLEAVRASLDPITAGELAEQHKDLARARKRLRFRNWVVAIPVGVTLVLVLALALNLLDRMTLTWVVAASPVWFGDPVAGRLPLDSVAIVTIQDAITPEMRPRHAALVDSLSRAGARVVAFDIRFQDSTAHDSLLAAAVERARARGTRVVDGANRAQGTGLALAPALVNRVSPGIDCLGENPLQFSGVVPLVWSKHDTTPLLPALPLAVVAAWWNAEFSTDLERGEVTLTGAGASVVDRIRLTKVTTLLRAQPGCPIMTAGSRYGEMLSVRAPVAQWRDPIRRFDYAAVLATPVERLTWARGKIVLVGAVVAPELSNRRIGLRRDARYGVERHADAIVTILANAEPIPVSLLAQNLLLAISAALGAWLAYYAPRRRLRQATAIVLAVFLGLALLSFILYWGAHRLLNVLYPALAFLLTFVPLLTLRHRWLP
jgi:CHASE2 domain-containing sensor protein